MNVIEKGDPQLPYCPNYGLKLQCSSCGSIAVLNCDSGYFYSKNIGDFITSHNKSNSVTISHWYSGNFLHPVCGINNGDILSIKINGVEYIN